MIERPPPWFHTHSGLQDGKRGLRVFDTIPVCLCFLRPSLRNLFDSVDACGRGAQIGRGAMFRLRGIGSYLRDLALGMSPLIRHSSLWDVNDAAVDEIRKAAALLRRAAIRLNVSLDDRYVTLAFRLIASHLRGDAAQVAGWVRDRPVQDRRELWPLLREAVDTCEERELGYRSTLPRKRLFSSHIDVAVGVLEWEQMDDWM